jgi:membrane protease YdiL (CAAX protease family)
MVSGMDKSRLISLIEVCAAILIVAAHNVFHLIPNEVPILFVVAITSFRIREGDWGFSLYSRPDSWPRTLLVAAACLALLVLKDLAFDPPGNVSSVITSARDVPRLLTSLAIAWGFAAFLEELGYRGYLLRRAVEAFGPSRIGSALALLTASAAFGLGHYYKGPAGMLDSAGSGLILGGAYLYTRRLWAGTLAHGAVDTIAVGMTFFGFN